MARSRYDARGMFWNDVYSTGKEKSSGAVNLNRPRPAIPDTGWKVKPFPDLSKEKIICIDVETRDEGITNKLGPGQYRDDSYVVGLAVGIPDQQWYFPFAHEGSSSNLDKATVLRWAKEQLTNPNQEKLGANIKYDLEWLAAEGVNVKGKVHDVQLAEPLIDETQDFYSLDYLASKYLGMHKEEEQLYDWLAMAFGGAAKRRSQAGRIWLSPPELAGPYAEMDVRLPFLVFEEQKKFLTQDELWPIYDLERSLVPLLVAMRQRGVKVDVDKRDQVSETIDAKIIAASNRLNEIAGREVSATSPNDLVMAFDKLGIKYGKTEAGNPSFPKTWLEHHPHPIAQAIVDVRKWSKLKGTFVDGYLGKFPINGRIHCEFNQLKSDDYGSVARFSSSNPNLQNIPKRDREIKGLIRSLFIPEAGCRWRRYDWSQIEFRLITNYGRGSAAEEARRRYRNDPTTDYHNMVADMTGLERDPAKNINFGLAYGMHEDRLAEELGMTPQGAKPLLELYHRNVPWVSDIFKYAQSMARKRGWVKTILGRRGRFTKWEAKDYKVRLEDGFLKLSYEQALDRYGMQGIRRADTKNGLSRVIQGGAADIMKKAMVDCYESGAFDLTGVPHLTVHDELGFSDEQTKQSEEGFKEVKHIMETCVKLRVPLTAECEVGPNWGNLEEHKE